MNTMNDLFVAYLDSRDLRPNTLRSYRAVWADLGVESLQLANLGTQQLAEAVRRARTNRRTTVKVLRCVCHFGREIGVLQANPAIMLRAAKATEKAWRIVGEDELGAVLRVAKRKLQLAVLLGRYCGLRASETVNLPWVAVDWEARTLTIASRGDWSTKSGRRRVVPWPDRLRPQLAAQYLRTGGAGLVFASYPGPWTRMHSALQRAIRKAGVKPWRYHDLRVTYITQLARGGVPMSQIAAVAGHASIAVTNAHYIEPSVDAVRTFVDTLPMEKPVAS